MLDILVIVVLSLIPIHTWFRWTLKKYVLLQNLPEKQLSVPKAPLIELLALLLRLGKGGLITNLLVTYYNFSDVLIVLLLLMSVFLHTHSPLQLFRKDKLWHFFMAGLLLPIHPVIAPLYLIGTLIFIILTNTLYLGELAGILLLFPMIWFLDLPPYLFATTIGFFLLILLTQINQFLSVIDNKHPSLLKIYLKRN